MSASLLRIRIAFLGALSTGLVLGLIGCPYGPRNLDRYPDRASSPYLLPFEAGTRARCVQGNNGLVSHNGKGEFAYDFFMPTGTTVHAARAGVVVGVKEDSNAIMSGKGSGNNYVRVRHEDGTIASYLHLQQGGALVKVGQQVAQRERIALSGNTGRSMMPHVHFHVRQGGRQIPVTFRDVKTGRGIPRSMKSYRARR